MGTGAAGRVTVEATVLNLFDLYEVRQGSRHPSAVRQIKTDAVVDPAATRLSLPGWAISELGLRKLANEMVRERDAEPTAVYTPAQLTVQGRECTVEVVRSADGEPAILGQTALLLMDWVIDPKGHRLIGNPAHGGEWMFELY